MRARAPAFDLAGRGFAYIGLLLFVAVFGAISAGVVAAGANLGQRAAEDELLWVGTQFRNAIRSYYEAGVGGRRFALTLPDLLRDPRFPGVRRHLRRVYPDPLTGSEDWGVVQAPGGGIMGVYSKSAAKPLKVEQFPTEFAAFVGKEKYTDWVFAYVPPGQVLPGASIGAAPARVEGAGVATPGATPPAAAPSAPFGSSGAATPSSTTGPLLPGTGK